MAEPPVATPRPVLVLYAPADEPFVRGYLLPAVGAAPDGAGGAAVDARDLSTIAITELEAALAACGVTVVVVSAALLASPWPRLSERLASGAALDRDLELIPLVLESCALPLHIREKVCLDFRFGDEWDAQARRLRDHLASPPPVEAPLPCPYPGMRPFEAADARHFHGRAADADAVIALADAGEREVYLVGPSGSGKSSLIAAGVVPKLAAQPGAPELVVRVMRPGDTPVRRLADCLEVEAVDEAAASAWAERYPGARLVLVVDQLEELFAVASPAEQESFAAALRAVRAEPRCLLVFAVRADFYAELLESQLWLDGRKRVVNLPPLRGAALREAIERPARQLEVYLERELIERLLADTAGEPGVLPLLQETLVQLWGRRGRRRLLTLAEYEALGEGGRSGLAVSISSRADRCLGELTGAQETIARRLLLRLVSFGEGRPNTRRRQTRVQLAGGDAPAEVDRVLRHLVAARLVTMDGKGKDEDDLVDLCHEVLISAWSSFAAWVEARRADELRRRQIQASAEEWIARGRGASGLLDEGELSAAVAWRTTDAARELGESAEVTALIGASRAAIARGRRRRMVAVASVVAGLAIFAAVTATLAVSARRQAEAANEERGRAEHRLGEQYLETARRSVTEGQMQRAIPYLVGARELGVNDPSLRRLFRIATTSWMTASLRHDAAVTSVDLSSDGRRIATASRDGTARLWDAASGAPLSPPLVHPGPVTYVELRGDGTRLLTISDDHAARIWDVTSTPPKAVELRHAGHVNAARFGAEGAMVVTASDDHTARQWSASTGAPVGPPLMHERVVHRAELSSDGSRIVTTSFDDGRGAGARLWNARTGELSSRLFRPAGMPSDPVWDAAEFWTASFSADGSHVLTIGHSQDAVVHSDLAVVWDWDPTAVKPAAPPLKYDTHILGGVFSPDGVRVAIWGHDGRVRIWNVMREAVGPVLEHPAVVHTVHYSRDGRRILTLCSDSLVRIWDAESGGLVTAIDVEVGVEDAAISPDGARVVTASADGIARVWEVVDATSRVLTSGDRYLDVAYSSDGSRIATASSSERISLWSASGALMAQSDFKVRKPAVTFARDDRRLAVLTYYPEIDLVSRAVPEIKLRDEMLIARVPGPPGAYDQPYLPAFRPATFSPDGRVFAKPGTGGTARVWDASTGLPVTPPLVHGAPVVMVRFSPDGRRLVTAAKDGAARVWDAVSGVSIGPLLSHPAGAWVRSAEFTPDGRHIVTAASDYQVRLWSAATNRLEATLSGHQGHINSTRLSHDGSRLVTASDDSTARIWDLESGRLAGPALEHRGAVSSAELSPDGDFVVTASDQRVQVWDVRTCMPLGPPFAHPTSVVFAMFSPDGRSVLTVEEDAVRIWDVGLDERSLDDWRRIARDGAYPQLAEQLKTGAPSTKSSR